MNQKSGRSSWKIGHEVILALLALLGGLPAVVVALVLLRSGDYTSRTEWTLAAFILIVWLASAAAIHSRIVYPLQTLSNLLAALREGDYSIRGRRGCGHDALGSVFREVNLLSTTLREERLSALEASALLRVVMEEIPVAVLAFDGERKLKLANRAGDRLLARPGQKILGLGAAELRVADWLDGDPVRTVERVFPGGGGRWGIRVSTFWEKGLPHQLLVLADLTQALRREELQAWKRLVRVLGHELNNSLTPIKSIAGSLKTILAEDPLPSDWREDASGGLTVIAARVEALLRFMDAYARLAKLPPPARVRMEVGPWISRVAGLETRLSVRACPGPATWIMGDGDQLDQLLINLVRNAVDASLETNGTVEVTWRLDGTFLEVLVADEGHGLANTGNLFVPFFTTKPGGSGIGLVLSRQIAEGHGGSLTLENRTPLSGCLARLRLPL